jgi:hypothetical protein
MTTIGTMSIDMKMKITLDRGVGMIEIGLENGIIIFLDYTE